MNFSYVEADYHKFRLTSMKFMLVYINAKIEKDELIDWVSEIGLSTEFVRVAHEEMKIDKERIEQCNIPEDDLKTIDEDEEGNIIIHNTYVLCKLNKKVDIKKLSFFQYSEEPLPKVLVITKISEFEKAKRFLGTIDKENNDLVKQEKNCYDLIAECKTLSEALKKYCNDPSMAGGIKTIYEASRGHSQVKRFNYEPDLTWQMQLLDEIDPEKGCLPDSRRIIWIYDKIGNSGKTGLSKWLAINRPNEFLCCSDLGTTRDASTLVMNALASGWTSHGICINLARSVENHERHYAILEMIKDGSITSQKYQGTSRIFDHPFVIVFSNWLPHTYCLSADRWDIRELTKNKDMIRLSLQDVRRIQEESSFHEEQSDQVDLTQRMVKAGKKSGGKINPQML